MSPESNSSTSTAVNCFKHAAIPANQSSSQRLHTFLCFQRPLPLIDVQNFVQIQAFLRVRYKLHSQHLQLLPTPFVCFSKTLFLRFWIGGVEFGWLPLAYWSIGHRFFGRR